MKVTSNKLLALIIAVVMLLPIIAVSTVALAAEEKTFVLDAQEHLTDMAQYAKKDGESDKVGTDNYFTLYYAAKTKIDTSKKSFPDGYNSAGASIRRINLQTKTTITETKVSAAIGFSISGGSTVKVWWVQGGDDNRRMAIYNAAGEIVEETSETLVKNDPCVSTFLLDDPGSYYLGAPDGNNYVFRVEVIEHEYVNMNIPADWSQVGVPVVQSAKDIGGALQISADAEVGKVSGMGICADKVTVTVKGGDVYGEYTASSVADGDKFVCEISPEWSGTYAVTATISREGEEDKVSAEYYVDYVLPLEAPYISSATSKGDGKIELEYTETREAEKYEILCGGEVVGETTELVYMVSGLTVGAEYDFVVRAVRGSETAASIAKSAVATADSKITWGFTYYGPSTGAAGNGHVGDLNEDGKVTVYSEGGKGKVQPASVDGLAFYYTKIPTSKNFTLKATVTVNSWTFSNGQEGFGLLVTDRLGVAGDTSNFWNNQYMAGTTKIEYRYESDEAGNEYVYDNATGLGSKYTLKIGLGMISKTGVTHENLSRLEAGDTDTVNNEFLSVVRPLDLTASRTQDGGTYNVIGNYTNDSVDGSLNNLLTTMVLEIERNNTGYFIRYYSLDGELLYEIKNYDPEALDQLDSEFVYAGFYAARNARATFSDVSLTTINPEDDEPAEERPITYVTPTVTLTSPSNTTSGEYTFAINTNVDGVVSIKNTAGKVIVPATEVKGKERYYATVTLDAYGEYDYIVEFNPDDDQDLGEYTELINNNNVYTELHLIYRAGNYHRKSVYVSVDGLYYGTGSKDDPYDLMTAINSAIPGQTIILMEGTYKFDLIEGQTLKIERGINGTEEEPIRLIADPNAKTRPVIDFGGKGYGMIHGGDWWIFEGFDVTGSANGQKGFQVSGNHNVLIDIHAYRNGNTGIQLSRYAGSDYTIADWPSYNLVLNCDSYYNMDAGHEDADGFAAKLTVGPGNVFDGCVAYNNADDGWDLYAKVQTGPIGAVTIQNCVAYKNGYLEDGTASKGNGNGFKMGGESITGHHVIKNSVAFDNRMKGIDSNSCPDIEAYNCISYNNGGYNVAFYTNNATDTAFKASGIISFKSGTEGEENLKGKGSQNNDDYINETTYYWNAGVCANSKGDKLDPAVVFKSLEFKGVTRNADGTWSLGDFLKINEGTVPAGVGTTGESTPSPKIELVPDLPHTYSENWVNTDPYVHWQECECGDKAHIGEHTFEYVIDKEPTETEVGYRHRECTVCGYKKAQVEIQPLGSQQTPEEPSFFQSIIDAIVNFFNQIVEWFQALFVGDKRQ